MAKGWYVVHTYSGYENKIEKIIRKMMESDNEFNDVVLDVKVPTEEVVEVKDGVKKTVKRKIFPSYILVQMDLPEFQW
ncbi:MAG: transcription termination/antitermination NusG family protein, partial [Sphaerochaetaceae bacterium]